MAAGDEYLRAYGAEYGAASMQLIGEVAGVDAVAVFLMKQRTDSHKREPCAAQKAEKLIIFWRLFYQRWHCGSCYEAYHGRPQSRARLG